MKLRLVVLSPGKWQGRTIPIARSPFLIGRDKTCQLRPASSMISQRHCALVVRDSRVFVRDLGSTNGTFLNDECIRDEYELRHGDWLRLGPLDFDVHIETSPPVNQATPLPPTRAALRAANEENVAAVLLSDQEGTPGKAADSEGIPVGRTTADLSIRPPLEWEDLGDAIEVRFTDRKILDDHKILVIGEQLRYLGEGSGHRNVVVNLANVRTMSSAMVDQLVTFARRVKSAGGRLVLCHIDPAIYPVFQHMRVARVFTIRKDAQEALQTLR
jgi:anti-anti-sigma factor